jgi:hypothetical protein
MSDTNDELRRHFEKIGEAAVQLHVNNGGFNPHVQTIAIEWLGQKAAESERLIASSQAEMAATASRAASAAERAAAAAETQARTAKHALITAIIATIIAAIALAVSIYGVLRFPGS